MRRRQRAFFTRGRSLLPLSLLQHRRSLQAPVSRQDLVHLLVPEDHAGLSGHS